MYATLMVHLELGRSNTAVLEVAAKLADQLHAAVVGIAGSRTIAVNYTDSYISPEYLAQIRDETLRESAETEAAFRAALRGSSGSLEWRSTLLCPSLPNYIAKEARCADLVLTAAASSNVLDGARLADTGELILLIGRPVLCIPAIANTTNLDNVVVAWKETREARRAVFDALPLLKLAKYVTVVELAEESELSDAHSRVDDVGSWLNRHSVSAECKALRSIGDEASQLDAIALKQGAGVIVAGAYGHSRVREFVFGGVTRDLLRNAEYCSFLSH
jgi:nucleotide-binding universal stress UspA family protein